MHLMKSTRPNSWAKSRMVFTFLTLFSVFASELAAQVTVSINKIDPSCIGYTNGTATATATGGTAPYTYRWSDGTFGNSVSGIGNGTYAVTATDAAGRTGTASTTFVQPSAMTITAIFANICTGGAITANTTGGTGPYTYNWGGGRTGATQTLSGGGYNLTVTDARGCQATKFIIVPTAFGVRLDAGELVCFGDCDAAISAIPQGGTFPFTYRWSTGATTQYIVTPAGTFSVTVTDANGCTVSATTTIANPPQIVVSTSINAPSCGGGANGSATATATGGRPPFTYNWSNGQTGQTATGLGVGTYFVTATDSRGCSRNVSVVVPSNAGFNVNVTKVDASCGSNNGSATATATGGGTAPFRYAWSNSATTQTVNNLGAGTYTVTVTDNGGCSGVGSVIVNASGGLGVTMSNTMAQCGISNGSATATPTSGTAPYTYRWSNGQTSSTITNLGPTTYTVTVTDARGCTAIGSTTVTQTSSFSVRYTSQQNVSCFGGNNGSLTAMPEGGSSPYRFAWSNGATTNLVANLTAGRYRVTVSDANNCTAVGTDVDITQPTAISITLTPTSTSCGSVNGSVNSSVTGGSSGTYGYQWSNGATTPNITNVAAGNYTLTVTDGSGCRMVASATVTSSSGLTAVVTATDARCFGASNGSASVTVSGASGTIRYAWSTGTSTTNTISGLAAGTYRVSITDANGCYAERTFTINQPNAITVNVTTSSTTCGSSNGGASAVASGGTPQYTYRWSNGATGQNVTGLSAGQYTVTATDVNGCTGTQTVTIGSTTSMTVTTLVTNVVCNAGNTGSATATVTGGSGALTYSWSNGATTATASGLTAGTYTVTVRDAAGCVVTQTATVEQPAAILISFSSVTNPTCTTLGSIANVNVSGGNGGYTYRWSNGATTDGISGLPAGNYTLTVTDSRGCIGVSATVTLTAPPALSSSKASTDAGCTNNGTATITAIGGTAPFTYRWSTGASSTTSTTSNSISGLAAGTYGATITDANGCTSSQSYTIAAVTSPTLSCTVVITRQISTEGGSDGMARVDAVNGLAPYTYQWNRGTGTTNQTVTNLSRGVARVTVTDSRGCQTICDATLFDPDCGNVTNGGTIIGDQTFCPGSAYTGVTEATPASGGTGSGAIQYLWMYSTTSTIFNNTDFQPIPSATGKDLLVSQMPTLTGTTYFIRCVRRAGCTTYIEGNVVTKTAIAEARIILAAVSVCVNRDITLSAPNSIGGTYTWTFTGANVATANGQTVTVRFTSLGTQTITLTVTAPGCTKTTSKNVEAISCFAAMYGSMIGFTANPLSKTEIQLNWATINEQQNSVFVVERSRDGINFKTIGQVNSQTRNSNIYRFNDIQAQTGRSFYRLRQVNTALEEVFISKVERVLNADPSVPVISYPNPATSSVFLEIVDADNTEGTFQVFDVAGRLVKSQQFSANQTRHEIDLNNLPRGAYVVKVNRNDGVVQNVKVTKQ